MKNFFKEGAVKRSICLLMVLVSVLSLVLAACGEDKPVGTGGDTTVANTVIDTQSFKFPEGFIVGSVNIGGMAYGEAFKAVEEGVAISVKDFDLKITAADKEYDYKKTDFQWIFEVEEALLEAAKYAESEDFKPYAETGVANASVYESNVSFTVDENSVNAIVDAIAKEVDAKAVDSTFTVDGDDVVISREKSGRQLDKADLAEKIKSEVGSLATGGKKGPVTIEAKVDELKPKFNFEGLDGEIKLISTYTTYSTNTLDGDHNMALALSSCNGSVINPGEVWSFNECTGDSNLESLGYRPATVIMNGKFEQGIGGGICQASSTIYNAAIMANMEIVERYCHAYQSSYVPAGRDATIDYPYLDLKLSNPTDYPMYMQCYMEDAYLTVNIFGWDDPAFDNIEIESSVHSANKTSYMASAWRVYYLDGEEVGREELHSSEYDYPEKDEPATTKPKETKPKATKPQTEKPKETKPKATTPKVTDAPETKPQTTTPVVTVPSEPEEVVTTPAAPQATGATSQNDQQIETATAHY